MPVSPLTADDAVIRAVLSSVRTIALVGASANPYRPSHEVMSFLQAKGYRVIPVNPARRTDLLGETVHARLADIGEAVDMVDISATAKTPVRWSIGGRHRARIVWMQLDVINEAGAARGRAAGLTVIMDRCPKIEIIRMGL
jgi:predicted CoA-binding protein